MTWDTFSALFVPVFLLCQILMWSDSKCKMASKLQMTKAERMSRNVLLPIFTASLRRCREGLQQRRELCVAMFMTARGQNRTFYFPPANCLISCCRWRAGRTVGEENRPVWAQGRAGPRFICLKLCDGFRLAPLWSFTEIPNSGIWRCLSTVPF